MTDPGITIIHSCFPLAGIEKDQIVAHYKAKRYVERWMPGDKLYPNTVHFTEMAPVEDRNGLENWKGTTIRFLSLTVALIESKGRQNV